jgi:AcrR family transcriptional regulator
MCEHVRMAPKSRAENRAEQTHAIQQTARRHLAEVGPAALSLRAIAREVGLVSSAVYRYFPSRDELLTALIIETYDELGDAVESAESAVADRDDLAARFAAVCHAIRDWARANPHEYALLYGSPVPGYVAPDDTVTPAIRVSGAFMVLAQAAVHAGRVPITTSPVSKAEKAALVPIQDFLDEPIDDAILLRWLMAWGAVFGHLNLELFGHLYRGVLDYDAHFAQVTGQLVADLGLSG